MTDPLDDIMIMIEKARRIGPDGSIMQMHAMEGDTLFIVAIGAGLGAENLKRAHMPLDPRSEPA